MSFTGRTRNRIDHVCIACLTFSSLTANGNSRELTISFADGTCVLIKSPSPQLDGYQFNVTVILQFHPLIVTRADQGLDVYCSHQQQISAQELDRSAIIKLVNTQCTYRWLLTVKQSLDRS